VNANRIVYICQTFPWVTQTFVIRDVDLLRKQGIDVQVASFRRPPDDLMDSAARRMLSHTTFLPPPLSVDFARGVLRVFRRKPLVIIRLTAVGLFSRGLLRTTWRMRIRGGLAALRGAWIADRFPDASHFHGEFADEAATAAMAAAELAGKSFSFKSHASFNPQQLERKKARAAFIVTESEFDRRYYLADVPRERVLVNRGGIAVRPRPGEPKPGAFLRILSVGTLQEKKGHRFLIAALALLRDRQAPFRCLIVGSGPLEAELHAQIEEAGLESQITLEPYRRHDAVAQLYRENDVFVLPCVVTPDGDRDGIPAVLIEAGAAGCALVSTPVSGIPELIRDGESGLLVAERDENGLAEALSRLVDPELRAALGRGAQNAVRERFDIRRNAAELADRFRSEISRSQS